MCQNIGFTFSSSLDPVRDATDMILSKLHDDDEDDELDDILNSKGKRVRFNLCEKMSDNVVLKQRCPQSKLGIETILDHKSFEELDFRLAIINGDDISESERNDRMGLLRDMCYYAGHYQWRGILKIYAFKINEIKHVYE